MTNLSRHKILLKYLFRIKIRIFSVISLATTYNLSLRYLNRLRKKIKFESGANNNKKETGIVEYWHTIAVLCFPKITNYVFFFFSSLSSLSLSGSEESVNSFGSSTSSSSPCPSPCSTPAVSLRSSTSTMNNNNNNNNNSNKQ